MFSARKKPLLLLAERLHSLRLSLNTPVVSTPELPAGPARAALVVHAEGGQTCFTVVVRSLRNGLSVLYELEGEDLNDASGYAVALDAALTFGESMGFLFDDEYLSDREPDRLRQAAARVRELVAPPEPEEEDGLLAPVEGDSEILLEEAVDSELAAAREPVPEDPAPEEPAPEEPDLDEIAVAAAPSGPVAVAPPPQAPPAPATSASVPLTKFRPVAAAEPPAPPAAAPTAPNRPAAAPGGARLGRVRPVRLRNPDAPPPVSPLLRLLAAF
jgi:hypothetical protein